MSSTNRILEEVKHFSNLEHIWWGAKTVAGQKRYDNRFQLLRRMCRPRQAMKILEIGCGDGEFTKRISKLSVEIIAIDVTPRVIQRAKRNLKFKKVIFKLENAEKLTFKDDTFDVVCGISILHHVDFEKALKETFRVLKVGGQIFFTEPNLLNPHIFLGLNIGFFRRRMEFSPGESAFIRWQLAESLRKAGFRQILVKNYDFLHPNTPSWAIGFVENLSPLLEKILVVKEISGSLVIWAKK